MRWRSLFYKKAPVQEFQEPYAGKIEIFSRHCFFSSISQHKKRLLHFSRERCYQNLLSTIDFEKANLTCILDTAKGNGHFLQKEPSSRLIEIQEGTEAGSFLKLLDHVEKLRLDPQTILYFVEDDYLHREHWLNVLLEGMHIPSVDYVTLYDHNDKYQSMYKNLRSKIYATASCHWRTVPSTTQTFAVRWKTLQEDLRVHRQFSQNRAISADHQKFMKLSKRGRTLISSMPGYSTHAELSFASPCFDWEALMLNTTMKGE